MKIDCNGTGSDEGPGLSNVEEIANVIMAGTGKGKICFEKERVQSKLKPCYFGREVVIALKELGQERSLEGTTSERGRRKEMMVMTTADVHDDK